MFSQLLQLFQNLDQLVTNDHHLSPILITFDAVCQAVVKNLNKEDSNNSTTDLEANTYSELKNVLSKFFDASQKQTEFNEVCVFFGRWCLQNIK